MKKSFFYITIIASLITLLSSCDTTPYASFTISDETAEKGEVVHFYANNSNGYFYYWEFGDGETSTEHSPSHSYKSTGNYEIVLSVFSKNGKHESVAVKTLTVNSDYIEINKAGLGITVYKNNTSTIVSDCHVYIFTNFGDYDDIVNEVDNETTNSSGEIVFSDLDEIVYYIRAFKIDTYFHWSNYLLAYKTQTLELGITSWYNIYVEDISKNKDESIYKIINIEEANK